MRQKRYVLQESSKNWELTVKVNNAENRLKKIHSSSTQEIQAESKVTRENLLEQDQFDAYFVPKFDIFIKYMKKVKKQRNGKNRQLRNDFINSIEGLD